jgi:hypothetical protein
MKHVRKAIVAGSAFLCATSLSFAWSDHGGVALSVASAQARVGRPATPVSVAGVARRHVRRGASVPRHHFYGKGGTSIAPFRAATITFFTSSFST